jgi:hypothetical protein
MFLIEHRTGCSHLNMQCANPGDSITMIQGLILVVLTKFASLCMPRQTVILAVRQSPPVHFEMIDRDRINPATAGDGDQLQLLNSIGLYEWV